VVINVGSYFIIYLTMIFQICKLIMDDELGITWKNVAMTCVLNTPFG
jgi:hypothetical protein